MRHDIDTGHGLRTSDVVRRTLLACGVVSSVLYAALDLAAGLQYDGYSFYSQTISELGAIGAPRPAFLAPLFLMYNVLVVVFGVAVLREGIRNNNRLRIIGALLLGYILVGSGTSFFPMHVRGMGTVAGDLPHIFAGLGATLVILVTMGIGSFTVGRGFKLFSWTTMATMLAFGALTAPFGVKLAHGEPTPGMGLLERLAYYSILVWIAGLSIALLRRARTSDLGGRP